MPGTEGMKKIIEAAVERGAADLHITAGDVFRARIDGRLVPLTKQRLTPEQTKAIALRLISSEDDRAKIDRVRDYDCSWGMPGLGRFRVNILRQRSSFMIVMRVIPFDVPSFESLHLPAVLRTVASTDHGLVLVPGPAGSGRSSTMAAVVNHINQNTPRPRRGRRGADLHRARPRDDPGHTAAAGAARAHPHLARAARRADAGPAPVRSRRRGHGHPRGGHRGGTRAGRARAADPWPGPP